MSGFELSRLTIHGVPLSLARAHHTSRREGVDLIVRIVRGESSLDGLPPLTRENFAREFEIVGAYALHNPNTPNPRRRADAFVFNRERARFLRGRRKRAPLRARETSREFLSQIEFLTAALAVGNPPA